MCNVFDKTQCCVLNADTVDEKTTNKLEFSIKTPKAAWFKFQVINEFDPISFSENISLCKMPFNENFHSIIIRCSDSSITISFTMDGLIVVNFCKAE